MACGVPGCRSHVDCRANAGFFTNLAVTAKVDGTCDLGLCGFGGFSPYMLLTFWLPFAAAAALTLARLWWAGRPHSN